MATATMEAATDTPRGKLRLGYVFRGLLGLAFSAVFIAADMVNNHSGATAEMGAVSGWLGVAAALGLFIVPMVAMEEGWSQGVRSAYWLCFAITAVFAVVSYFHEFDMRANAVANANRIFADATSAQMAAEADRARAQAEADEIRETRPSAALKALYDAAEDKRKLEASPERKGCGTLCKQAETDASAALKAWSQAQAKERAQARADDARKRVEEFKEKARGGQVSHKTIPTRLAGWLGGDVLAWANGWDVFLAALLISLSLTAATLVDSSLHCIAVGLGLESAQAVPIVTAPADVEQDAEAEPAAPMTERERQIALALEIFAPSAATGLLAGDVQERFVEAHIQRWPELPAPRKNIISQVMADAGFTKDRKKGPTRYHVALN